MKNFLKNYFGPQENRSKLERQFYALVPKARKINPFFREQFNMVYEASELTKQGGKLLNFYASKDLSSYREECFRKYFFPKADYHVIDVWDDTLTVQEETKISKNNQKSLHINHRTDTFDVVITTKVVLEHVSDPWLVISEMCRVLKPDGKIFVIAPHIRRQHQPPHDYFRFTEHALKKIFEESGFIDIKIKNTGGFMAVIGYYFYFFQRGLDMPRTIEKFMDKIHYHIIEPIFYFLDRFDNGYGRDMTLYFIISAKKQSTN